VAHPKPAPGSPVTPGSTHHDAHGVQTSQSRSASGTDLMGIFIAVLRDLSRAHSVSRIAETVVRTVPRLVPNAGGCTLYLLDESGEWLHPSTAHACSGPLISWKDIPLDSELSRRVFQRETCSAISDTQLVDQAVPDGHRSEYPVLLALPLGHSSDPLGMLGVRLSGTQDCAEEQVQSLGLLAGCALLAIEREHPRREQAVGEAVFDSVPAGLVITDSVGRIVAINEPMWDMIGGRGQISASLPCSLKEGACPPWMTNILDPCRGTVIGPYSVTLDLSEDDRHTFRVAPASLGAGDESTVYLVLDVSADREVSERRAHFTAQVAHELRTPLQHIMGFASILTDIDELDDETYRRFLRHIGDESKRLARLVDDLADLSHFDNGRFAITKTSTRVDALLDDVVTRLSPVASAAEIEVKLAGACPSITIQTDKMRVEQVLANLIENALKFTQPGGQIVVSCSASDREVTLSVSDNGPGIPGDALQRIFERFYQIPQAQSQAARRGMGLGLYISREIVHSLGGQIWVESELGKGSTFSFRVPRE